MFSFLILHSCVDTTDVSNGDEKEELYLEAHIRPNSIPRASLRTTELFGVVGQEVIIAEFDEANMVLKDLNSGEEKAFVYEGNREYVINDPFWIKEGTEYEIKAALVDHPEFEEVNAKVEVPTADVIKEVIQNEVLREELLGSDGVYYKFTYDVDVVFQPENDQEFYMIEPRAIVHGFNGTDFFIRNGNLEYFDDFFGANTSGNILHAPEHLRGAMINIATAANNTVNLIFSSTVELQPNVDYLPFIDFRIHTLSDSYYKYNLSKSRQLKSEGVGGAQPVISYSNVTSGRGGFTALSTEIYDFTVTY